MANLLVYRCMRKNGKGHTGDDLSGAPVLGDHRLGMRAALVIE